MLWTQTRNKLPLARPGLAKETEDKIYLWLKTDELKVACLKVILEKSP